MGNCFSANSNETNIQNEEQVSHITYQYGVHVFGVEILPNFSLAYFVELLKANNSHFKAGKKSFFLKSFTEMFQRMAHKFFRKMGSQVQKLNCGAICQNGLRKPQSHKAHSNRNETNSGKPHPNTKAKRYAPPYLFNIYSFL